MEKIITDNLTKSLDPISFKKFLKCLGFMTEVKAKQN